MKKIIDELPFHVDPPTIRRTEDYVNDCSCCRYFGTETMAYPGGWCMKYRCQQVNAGVGFTCDDYEERKR